MQQKSAGTATLNIFKSSINKYRHTIYPKNGWENIKVDSYNFDELLNQKLDGIKMDVEGAEIDIFDNEHDWGTIKKLTFEYHFDFDNIIDNFLSRMERLRIHFDEIYYGKLKDGETEYNYFPQAKMVYCKKTK